MCRKSRRWIRHTVFEAVAEGLGDLRQLLTDYHHAVQALSTRPTMATKRCWRPCR